MRIIKYILVGCVFVLLSGCSSMNASFDCPMQNGISCKSLDEVNAAIDAGVIAAPHAPILAEEPSYLTANYGDYKVYPAPIRQPDKSTHIWVTPFVDMAGNYHAASDVYVVTRPSFWLGNFKTEIRSE